MAKQRESALSNKILAELRQRGWKAWKNAGGPFADCGMPDVMAVKGGVFVAIETKTDIGKLTELQKKWMRELESHGAFSTCERSVQHAVTWAESVFSKRAKQDNHAKHL